MGCERPGGAVISGASVAVAGGAAVGATQGVKSEHSSALPPWPAAWMWLPEQPLAAPTRVRYSFRWMCLTHQAPLSEEVRESYAVVAD